ncbi:hypothetical protein BDY24DRAFT_400705 [Mrakia frigida]|uniref:uncharacterized protein n=1 Tax=Mrakia frigida TaxID=29902 RepID=UPI003FCC1A0A
MRSTSPTTSLVPSEEEEDNQYNDSSEDEEDEAERKRRRFGKEVWKAMKEGKPRSEAVSASTLTRMRWSDSDAAKVTKRVEKYLSKNRGNTSQREYVEKHLKNAFPGRPLHSTMAKFKGTVRQLSSSKLKPNSSKLVEESDEEEVVKAVSKKKEEGSGKKPKRKRGRRLVSSDEDEDADDQRDRQHEPDSTKKKSKEASFEVEEDQHSGGRIDASTRHSSRSSPEVGSSRPDRESSAGARLPPIGFDSNNDYSRSSGGSGPDFPRKLKIREFDHAVTEEDLRVLFEPFGRVRIEVSRHRAGHSLGFGFAEFEQPEDARRAKTRLDGIIFRGKPLEVFGYRPRPDASCPPPPQNDPSYSSSNDTPHPLPQQQHYQLNSYEHSSPANHPRSNANSTYSQQAPSSSFLPNNSTFGIQPPPQAAQQQPPKVEDAVASLALILKAAVAEPDPAALVSIVQTLVPNQTLPQIIASFIASGLAQAGGASNQVPVYPLKSSDQGPSTSYASSSNGNGLSLNTPQDPRLVGGGGGGGGSGWAR